MQRVIGIDPGSIATGLGIVDVDGSKLSVAEYGFIKTDSKDFARRLKTIFLELDKIIKKYKPDEFAIEKVFVNKNVESALKLGQARGVAIVAAAINDIPVFEYSPNAIKKAVVGTGHANKNQVQTMIQALLNIKKPPQADAADALACAVCHINNTKVLSYMQKSLQS